MAGTWPHIHAETRLHAHTEFVVVPHKSKTPTRLTFRLAFVLPFGSVSAMASSIPHVVPRGAAPRKAVPHVVPRGATPRAAPVVPSKPVAPSQKGKPMPTWALALLIIAAVVVVAIVIGVIVAARARASKGGMSSSMMPSWIRSPKPKSPRTNAVRRFPDSWLPTVPPSA